MTALPLKCSPTAHSSNCGQIYIFNIYNAEPTMWNVRLGCTSEEVQSCLFYQTCVQFSDFIHEKWENFPSPLTYNFKPCFFFGPVYIKEVVKNFLPQKT